MVEWKKLGDLLDYEQPTSYLVNSTEYDESYNVPVLTAGQSLVLGYTNETEGIYQASKENPTIIFDDFTTSFHWIDYKFKVKSSAMKMLRPKKDVNFRYVYYAMLGINFVPGGHQRHWISKYSNFEIPIPSLSEQQRIVSILDTFTSSISNLKQQIEERRKQYEYERDLLLDLEGKEGVEMKKLGEVCEIKNGYTPSTKKPEFWENGSIPWFTLEDIRKNGRILSDAIKHITPTGVKKSGLFPQNSIIVSTTATIGEYALITRDFLCNQQISCISVKEATRGKLLPKYLYYLSNSIGNWCKKNVNGGGSLLIVSTSKLNNLFIPLPPLSTQSRIVSILDTFEQSISNLEEQLAMREKQYEYYRNQLLTFEGEEERGKT